MLCVVKRYPWSWQDTRYSLSSSGSARAFLPCFPSSFLPQWWRRRFEKPILWRNRGTSQKYYLERRGEDVVNLALSLSHGWMEPPRHPPLFSVPFQSFVAQLNSGKRDRQRQDGRQWRFSLSVLRIFLVARPLSFRIVTTILKFSI